MASIDDNIEEWSEEAMEVLNGRVKERNTVTFMEFERYAPLFSSKEEVRKNVDINELCEEYKTRFSLYNKIYIVDSMANKDNPILVLPPLFRSTDPINSSTQDLSTITSALDTAFRVNDDFKIKRNGATARVLRALDILQDNDDIKEMQDEFVQLSSKLKHVVTPEEKDEVVEYADNESNTVTSLDDWEWD